MNIPSPSKISRNLRRFNKLITIIAVISATIGIVAASKLAIAEFYPDRTPYDYSKPCDPNDSNKYDRCGSLDGPVFNSFINTPSYGDERAFVDARRSDQTGTGDLYKNVLNDVDEGSKEIVVRMYVHNNANQSTNSSGVGIARNTKVRVLLPTAENSSLRARGYISADNADTVEDTVDFTAKQPFTVAYVPGSAVLYNNDSFKNGVKLSDNIVTTGALIGTDKLDGNVKGCFEYESVIEIKLKVSTKETPKLKFEKEVRKKGSKDWQKHISTKPGDEVEWLLTAQNVGENVLNNVTLRDVLPPHVKLVPGSVTWIAPSQTVVQGDKPLFDGGIIIGNYATNGGAYIKFNTKILNDLPEDKCEIVIRNLAYAKSDQTSEIEDYADVSIKKDNCNPPKPEKPTQPKPEEKPVYECKALDLVVIGKRTVKVTVTPRTKGNVSVSYYTYSFGDNTPEMMTDKDTVEHTFEQDGTYVVRVTITFDVNNRSTNVDSDLCSAPITFTSEQPLTPAPTSPKPENPSALPSTGPTEIVGIFVATTVAGMIAYNMVYRRYYL